MALKIIRKIAVSLQGSDFFTTMADETTDASNKEQVVICIRWVDNDLRHTRNSLGCMWLIPLMLARYIK